MTIGPFTILRERRLRAGLSLEAVATKVKATRSQVSRWERMETSPRDATAVCYAYALGISTPELLALYGAHIDQVHADLLRELQRGGLAAGSKK